MTRCPLGKAGAHVTAWTAAYLRGAPMRRIESRSLWIVRYQSGKSPAPRARRFTSQAEAQGYLATVLKRGPAEIKRERA